MPTLNRLEHNLKIIKIDPSTIDYSKLIISMKHLVILQNGLNGFHLMMSPVRSFLTKNLSADHHIIISPVNNWCKTHDGIENGGYRLYQFIKKLLKQHKYGTLSFIGHSLGGLYIRYCIGLLHSDNTFDTLTPHVFSTVVTPHIGIVNNSPLIKWLSNLIIGQTGQDLLIKDKSSIISIMSENQSSYVLGLSKFKHKIIYGNLKSDSHVPFETACICPQLKLDITFTPLTLLNIDPKKDCNQFTDELSLQLYNNLSQIQFIRKAIDMSSCYMTHNAILNKGLSKQTQVLEDLLQYFHY